MDKKFSGLRIVNILTLFVFCLLLNSSIHGQENGEISCDFAYNAYREAKKLPCGQRAEAIKAGKYIIEKFKDETENKQIVDFIKQDLPKIEEEEKQCNFEALYNIN